MPGPKHKKTKSKIGMRRSHHRPTSLLSVRCPSCGELKQAHTVCSNCGYYKDRKVLTNVEEV